jgi:hypothetical protein
MWEFFFFTETINNFLLEKGCVNHSFQEYKNLKESFFSIIKKRLIFPPTVRKSKGPIHSYTKLPGINGYKRKKKKKRFIDHHLLVQV